MTIFKTESRKIEKNGFKYSCAYTGLFAFLIIFLIMLPSIIRFNGLFIIRGDYVDQFIMGRWETRKILYQDNPLWNWANFLGCPAGVSLNAVIPFDFMCYILPINLFNLGIDISIALRFVVAAMTSYCYLTRFVSNRKSATIGALLYAFSSFSIVMLEFAQFLNCVALFPLMLIGIEDIFTRKRSRHILIFAVYINLFMSPYSFIAQAVTFTAYSLVKFFFAEDWKEKKRVKTIFHALLEFMLGVFLYLPNLLSYAASILSTSRASTLLPTASALDSNAVSGAAGASGVSGASSLDIEKLLGYLVPGNILNRIATFFIVGATNRFCTFFNEGNWSSVHAYIPIFGSCFAIAYFRKHKKDWKKKYLVVLLVISFVSFLNESLVLFTTNYTRWWYILVLAMVLITVSVIDKLEDYTQKELKFTVKFSAIAIFILLLVNAGAYGIHLLNESSLHIGFIDLVIKNFFSSFLSEDSSSVILRLQIYSVALSVIFLIVTYFIICSKKAFKALMPIVVCALIIYGSSFVMINNTSESLFNYNRESKMTLDEMVDTLYFNDGPVNESNEYRFRVDHPNELHNYWGSVNESTISTFDSTVNSRVMEFCMHVGIAPSSESVRLYPHGSENSVRSLLSVKYFYNHSANDESVKIPEGFKYKETVGHTDVYENENFLPFGFAYDSYMLMSDYLRLLSEGKIEQRNGDIMLETLIIDDVYEEFVSDILSKKTDANVNLEEAIKRRGETVCTDFVGNNKGFTANIKTDKESVLFFSVPDSSLNWTAKVNGEETDIIIGNICFMAIKVPKGESNIEFTYGGTYENVKMPIFTKSDIMYLSAGFAIILYIVIYNVLVYRRNKKSRIV